MIMGGRSCSIGPVPTDADDEPGAPNEPVRSRAGLWARAVPVALGVIALAWVMKIIAVAVALVGPGLLGYQLADQPGVMVGITVGALVVLTVCYLAVTRTGDGASVVHEISAESIVWVSGGWTVAMGWLLGDAVSSVGAVVGLVLAIVAFGVVGLVVISKLDGGLVPTLRRRAVRR